MTGNIPAMRNIKGAESMLQSVYLERELLQAQVPGADLPPLHDRALPLHHFVQVDLFIPAARQLQTHCLPPSMAS